jgi:transcriptional regulator with XRE-family HTH domain
MELVASRKQGDSTAAQSVVTTVRRAITKVTQAKMAERLGIDAAAMSRFMNGEPAKLTFEDVCGIISAAELAVIEAGTGTVTMSQREADALRFYAERGFNSTSEGAPQ